MSHARCTGEPGSGSDGRVKKWVVESKSLPTNGSESSMRMRTLAGAWGIGAGMREQFGPWHVVGAGAWSPVCFKYET
jgi:hypothetical protein